MEIMAKENMILKISTKNPESLDILHTWCFRKEKIKYKIRDKPP